MTSAHYSQNRFFNCKTRLQLNFVIRYDDSTTISFNLRQNCGHELNESIQHVHSMTWQQNRHVCWAKVPQRTNCVTSWNNSQLLNNPFRVIKCVVKLYPVTNLCFGLPFPTTGKVSCFAATAWLLCRPSTCQNKTSQQSAHFKQPKLTFRFSRFRTFFSTIVRHCFSVISLASDAITLSCCLTQSDGIFLSQINNHVLFTAPRQPAADGTVSFATIVSVNGNVSPHVPLAGL